MEFTSPKATKTPNRSAASIDRRKKRDRVRKMELYHAQKSHARYHAPRDDHETRHDQDEEEAALDLEEEPSLSLAKLQVIQKMTPRQ